MDYPAPAHVIATPPRRPYVKWVIIVGVIVAVAICFFIVAAIAIGLGVGLGVGLTRGGSSNTATSATTKAYSILSPPSVTCTYGGSTTCGCAATAPSFLSPRIINGYAATPYSWPWIVALYINNDAIFCGGFLITYQHVITAAHCVSGQSASTITVYAGIQSLSARSSSQSRVVSSFQVHPSYSTSGYTNDIAILTLQSAFTETSIVGKCCLTYDTSLPSVGEHAVIAGWGTTSTTSSSVSNDLLQGVIEVQGSSSSCNPQTSIQFCAGYDGTDSCYGDSGSPLMTSVNNSWTCTGIVSSGRGCGQSSYYTRVSAYESFIKGIING